MVVEFLTFSADQTEQVGANLAALLLPGDVVAMIGDLGTGKTTLARGLANGLKVKVPASSPTFSLINHLYGSVPVIHMDAYRLSSSNDLFELGFYDLPFEASVLLVEWEDRILDALPEDRITVEMSTIPDAADARRICIRTGQCEAANRINQLKGAHNFER